VTLAAAINFLRQLPQLPLIIEHVREQRTEKRVAR
jgi:hypothetical protein